MAFLVEIHPHLSCNHLHPKRVETQVPGHSSFSLGEESPCLCHTVKDIEIQNQFQDLAVF